MFAPAFEAAEYAVAALERRIDALAGRGVRLAAGRYAAVLVLGIPVALVAGSVMNGALRWTGLTTWGLAAGIALVAAIDILRLTARHLRARRVTVHRRNDASALHDALRDDAEPPHSG